MTCGRCVPWNLPLLMPSHLSAFGALVPLTFQDGLWYHLHVAVHQKDNWAGEIEDYTKNLLDQPLKRD